MPSKHNKCLDDCHYRTTLSVPVYTNFDSMSSDVKQETMNGIYLDQFKAYYYLNKQEDNLRVSKITAHSLPYTLAFVDRGHPLLPLHNNCFVERLENAHYRGEKFVEKYINLVKVRRLQVNYEVVLNMHPQTFGAISPLK